MILATLLIVEDQAIIAGDLEDKLVRGGYQICGIATTAEEALDLARRHRPALALMDIRLQGAMDGIQTADIMRRELDIPVIFLSAHSDELTLQRAKAVNPYGFLVKPFDERELRLNIAMAIRRHEDERQAAVVQRAITILIVEDQEVVAADLKERLVLRGYAVCGIAATVAEALELARRQQPELALVDIRLDGDMDGIELAQILRHELDIPVIFLSAHSDDATMLRATQATPYAFLMKPYDDRELQLNVEVAVHKHAGERQLAIAHQDIRRLNATLEQRVTERTAEVVQAMADLKLEAAERMRTLDRLLESETRFRQLAENIREVFFLIDAENTCVFYISPAYEEIWGRTCDSLRAQPQSRIDAIHAEDRGVIVSRYAHGQTKEASDDAYRIVRPDGSVRWIRSREFPIFDGDGVFVRIAGIADDITEKREQERKIARLSRFSAMLSGINSAIVRIHDRQALFQEACRIAVSEGGFNMASVTVFDSESQDSKILAICSESADETDAAQVGAGESEYPISLAMHERRPVICNDIRTELSLESFSAELVARGYLSIAAFPLIPDQRVDAVITLFGNEINVFDDEELMLLNELAGDLSFGLQFIAKEQQLSYLAYYDTLTGLPNRRLFHERMGQFLLGMKLETDMVAVGLIDLVRFAQLNDVHGRNIGDLLLRDVAKRMQASLGEAASLARIGGDTFAVMIPDLKQVADAAAILEQQIFSVFEQVFNVNQREIHLEIRASLAVYPNDGSDAETLFKHAEIALKKTKIANERYLYYASQMNKAVALRLTLERELRVALETHQFQLYYQPRVDLLSGRIVSAEALIRWRHPERGMIPPIQFIPLAEETALIVPIGAWVIDAVCAQQASWSLRGVKIVPVAVNLSAVQFKKGRVLQTIRDAMAAHGIQKESIEFELTESVVMDEPEEAATNLKALKEIGGALALDDFGTGYSSLAYLKRFPFDIVKIDRAFVVDITRSPEDAAIAAAVIVMAHRLNMRVVAEGVETEAQLSYLRKLRCDELQGYYFSPPIPAEEFEILLREDKRLSLQREPIGRADTILVVDDDVNNLAALKRALRLDGYRILMATSGQDALELLALNAIQVVVTDQHMPHMSGTDFLAIVKELYPDIMRLIMTGSQDLEIAADSINRGAIFKFIKKPWADEILRDQIQDSFRHYRRAE